MTILKAAVTGLCLFAGVAAQFPGSSCPMSVYEACGVPIHGGQPNPQKLCSSSCAAASNANSGCRISSMISRMCGGNGPRPTPGRGHRTRPDGPGGSGGCTQECPAGEVCRVTRNEQCISALINHQELPPSCMTCVGRGSIPTPRPGAPTHFHRPTRPAYTRPGHYTHEAHARSCARWNTADGQIPGGVHNADTCTEFCTAYQGTDQIFTPANATDPASCCCSLSRGGQSVRACCDVTDVAPTVPGGGGLTEPVSAECTVGSFRYDRCVGIVSQLALKCSAAAQLADNCNVFAPPGSDAFNDCEAVYDCMVTGFHNITAHYTRAPTWGMCCPCVSALGGQIPGDQWLDDVQCSNNPNANGDDDDTGR